MREISLQQIFALIPSTVGRYITFGLKLLLAVLRVMPEAAIKWPKNLTEFEEYNDLIIEQHPLLMGAFASIDGLNLACQTSDDEEIENSTYNGWLCKHFVSSVLVFSPKAPIKSGQKITGTAEEIGGRLAFDCQLLLYRQTAEWGMHGLQGSFGHFRIPLEINRQEERGDLLEICVQLNNVRAQLVGINQIRNAPANPIYIYELEWA
ncbi:hypothetical protein C8R43DRAFT_1089604 [Mycena crocata]|nr:hypothetical protein C8R43DRAFT_1089604 [Mycena crocata]